MASQTASHKLSLPPNFGRVSSTYRIRVWVALIGLLTFIAFYLGLAVWFSLLTVRMFRGTAAGGGGASLSFFSMLPPLFFAIFLWKALFFFGSSRTVPGIEVTAATEPRLFESLHQLIQSIGAPQPHRVFLTPNVNACVFFDVSILNLLLPTKKNLAIGLGAVNCLNRSEFEAVLAHEFGHFAQRSMTVGRYVALAEHVASHIISKRDVIDRALDGLSCQDFRIAWIGWILRLVVWSLRSLLETAFRWVVLAQRALSRQMEFHADLVSVSQCGSDAIVNALYKLQSADEDWDVGLDFANSLLRKNKRVSDLYTIQSHIAQLLRQVLDDPSRGRLPPMTGEPSRHRIFSKKIAQPPKMWSTHPPNDQREANAKQTYVASRIDERPAWSLFSDPKRIRETMTDWVAKDITFESQPEVLSDEAILKELDRVYNVECFSPDYRGTYRNRRITLNASSADDLLEEPPPRNQIQRCLDELYPISLGDQVKRAGDLAEQIALLTAAERGHLETTNDVVQYQGESFSRSKLPALIAVIRQEQATVLEQLNEHDRRCRTAHDAAARYVAADCQKYLNCLRRLLHYAEHSEANLGDALEHLNNVAYMITAAGRPNEAEIRRVMASANDLQQVMQQLEDQKQLIVLPPRVLEELQIGEWKARLDDLKLPPATRENLNSWMQVVHSWATPMLDAFGALRVASLNELLRAERAVAQSFVTCHEPTSSFATVSLPTDYGTRVRGSERPKQQQLDSWRRFTLADGAWYGGLRFATATTIFGMVVAASHFLGQPTVAIYNGLETVVHVELNGVDHRLDPVSYATVPMSTARSVHVRSTIGNQTIDDFRENIDLPYATYAYNVGQSALFCEVTWVYGAAQGAPPKLLGCPRWMRSRSHYTFTAPPQSLDSHATTRKQLTAVTEVTPYQRVGLVESTRERAQFVRSHMRWDSPHSQTYYAWCALADSILPDRLQVVQSRLSELPNDYVLLRAEYDLADDDSKREVLQRHLTTASQHPDSPDWQYIACRYEIDHHARSVRALSLFERWPEHPACCYAAANAHAGRERWGEALELYEKVIKLREPLAEASAIATLRIRRILADDPQAVQIDDLPFDLVRIYQAFDTGESISATPEYAYFLLQAGRLDEANEVGGDAQISLPLKILLGASQDSTAAWQQRALEASLADVTRAEYAYYLATIAQRNGKSYEAMLERAEVLSLGHSPLTTVIRKLLEGPVDPNLTDQLDGMAPDERSVAYVVACLLDPVNAREKWRDYAKRALFAFERPYLSAP